VHARVCHSVCLCVRLVRVDGDGARGGKKASSSLSHRQHAGGVGRGEERCTAVCVCIFWLHKLGSMFSISTSVCMCCVAMCGGLSFVAWFLVFRMLLCAGTHARVSVVCVRSP
jgi:hypothetical protein